MADPNYDPQKAHDYYVRHRELKGRRPGAGDQPHQGRQPGQQQVASAQQKVHEIEAKLGRLRSLLAKKMASPHKSSSKDKPKTAADKLKDRQNSKDYYNKHKASINAKKKSSSGGGGSSSAGSYESMSADELKTAIRNTVVQLKAAIAHAQSLRGG